MMHSALSTLILPLLIKAACGAEFPWGTPIPQTGWTATADSFQAGNEPANAIDGNSSTFWHTQYNPSDVALPHYLQIDMKKSYVINGLSYTPRQDGNSHGNIGLHAVTVSNDGETWSDPIQYGSYENDASTKDSWFSNTTARYVRLSATSEAEGLNCEYLIEKIVPFRIPPTPSLEECSLSVAELNIYSPDPNLDATTFEAPPTSQGRWGQTVMLPIVPVAGALGPGGNVVFWSAYRPDLFTGSTTHTTYTVTWNSGSQAISERDVTETGHDMFCPGISLDANGRITVTGGNDAAKTSTYDPSDAVWKAQAQMNIARGYQSSVTIGDGRIFTIGGSWSGGWADKPGEIYEPKTDTWTYLPGCDATPMLTNDAGGVFRSDNHAWLFSWKANAVLQAGPSKNMHWYNVTSTNGSYISAGTRAADGDSMCGTASMYDAVNGLILSAGGSPSYEQSDATSNVHVIKLGDANAMPTVTQVESMKNARAFGNSAVLPDGTVLVTGGQSYAVPFTDTTPAWEAELFNPATNTWTTMASIAVPRTYHSFSMLLPDATVAAGGGGLCGTGCYLNHFDMQIFSPPYLFNSDGSLATRPVISSVSSTQLSPGSSFTVETTGDISSFSLIRFSSVTHSVNTDQRRVPCQVTATSGSASTIALPTDPGVLVPGYWMLFAVDSAGVPSVATTVQIVLP
ncbi:copper radical oxidase [Xylariaceae sp. FL1019]|nr:copper radical oxidase [Xylariaceae sp. FL1019]